MKKLSAIPVLILICALTAFAQDSKMLMPSNLGAYLGANLNMHTPSFVYPIDANHSVGFNENSMNLGLAAGLIGNFPLSDLITISGRIGYNGLSGEFSKRIQTLPDTNKLYTFTSSMNWFELAPVVQFHNLLPVRNLYFLANLEVDIPFSNKYSLKDEQSAPVSSTTMIADSKELDWTVRVAGALGAGYIIPLSPTMFLTPEVSYRIPFTQVSSNNYKTWEVPQLRLTVALTFGLSPLPVEPEIGNQKFSDLQIAMKEVRYYDKEGNRHPLTNVRVEDIHYTELFPLIPYVFFDSNKAEPNPGTQILESKSDKGQFSFESIEPDAMKINTRTLDIVGLRLQNLPNTELTITGTIDPKGESSDKDLPKKRAEFAKDYLVKEFKVNPDKINIRIGGLPEKPSSVNVPEGVEENRRVELSSSNKKLLEPILMRKESQSIAEPNMIEFVPAITSTDSVSEWKFEVIQADRPLRTYFGSGEIEPLQFVIIPNELTSSQIPIDYNFTASNVKGLSRRLSSSIPVDYFSSTRKKAEEQPDKTISKYSLILFDFDKAEISQDDMKIIDEYIVPDIKFNSIVRIYGYTDKIGDANYNKKLAERRAESVKTILESKAKTAKFEVHGVGENEVIFDNNSPVGRLLSRTVQVYIITPR